MQRPTTSETRNRVAIILAGGEGVRLRSLTTRITGAPTPKQFCPLMGDLSLLQQTVRRVGLSFPRDRIITVVNREHELFYNRQLSKVPASQLVVQPTARGTAPAIIYALFRALQFGRDTCVAVLPLRSLRGQRRVVHAACGTCLRGNRRPPRVNCPSGDRPGAPRFKFRLDRTGRANTPQSSRNICGAKVLGEAVAPVSAGAHGRERLVEHVRNGWAGLDLARPPARNRTRAIQAIRII